MVRTVAAVVCMIGLSASVPGAAQDKDAKALIERVVQEAGGASALHAKKDVEYTYIYRGADGKMDVSVERYVFDGEKSWARYDVHEKSVYPKTQGLVVQGYDGKTTWETVAGKRTPQDRIKLADFLRKTNFYWFAMTFKLLDPGLKYAHKGQRRVGKTNYELVELTFDVGVGDVSDTYLLYVNPKTWRVDQFLFTVLDFGRKDPFLMKVEYERVDGVLLPVKRVYAEANWDGKITKASDTEELSVGIRFSNGFGLELFEAPRD